MKGFFDFAVKTISKTSHFLISTIFFEENGVDFIFALTTVTDNSKSSKSRFLNLAVIVLFLLLAT